MSAPHEWWEFFFRMPSNTQPSMWLSSLRKVSRTLRQFRSGRGISFGSCLMDLFRGGRAPLAATAGFTVNSYRFSLTVAAALLLPDRSSRLPCAKRTRTFFFFFTQCALPESQHHVLFENFTKFHDPGEHWSDDLSFEPAISRSVIEGHFGGR